MLTGCAPCLVYNNRNMKTIAITIEEDVLERLDRLGAGNRSKLIRDAVRDYLTRRTRRRGSGRGGSSCGGTAADWRGKWRQRSGPR